MCLLHVMNFEPKVIAFCYPCYAMLLHEQRFNKIVHACLLSRKYMNMNSRCDTFSSFDFLPIWINIWIEVHLFDILYYLTHFKCSPSIYPISFLIKWKERPHPSPPPPQKKRRNWHELLLLVMGCSLRYVKKELEMNAAFEDTWYGKVNH